MEFEGLEVAATTTQAKIRMSRAAPKTVSGILKAGIACRTVVDGVMNMPPK